MKILLADDDPTVLAVTGMLVEQAGHEPVTVRDGEAALAALSADGCPRMAILDWMMPGRDGVDVCREVKRRTAESAEGYVYILMLTSRDRHEDLVEGFGAGADDFLRKPVREDELRCRIAAGERVIRFDQMLREKNRQLHALSEQQRTTIAELRQALEHVRMLQGLLPVCSSCKKVRDDTGYWSQIEVYLSQHADIQVTHGLCPDCAKRLYPKHYKPEWNKGETT